MKVFRMMLSTLFVVSVICCSGCGSDDDGSQEIHLSAGREIIYEGANGELRLAHVVTDHGNTLTVDTGSSEIQLSESEVLGIGGLPPGSFDTFTFAKGRHLDAYGDKYADIEHLHGGMTRRYRSITSDETVAAEIKVHYGTTASGEEIGFDDRIYVLLRKGDYW